MRGLRLGAGHLDEALGVAEHAVLGDVEAGDLGRLRRPKADGRLDQLEDGEARREAEGGDGEPAEGLRSELEKEPV